MAKMVGACGLERIVYHSSIHHKHAVGGMISHRAVTKWLKRIDRSGELAWDRSTLFSMAAAWRVTRHHTEVARAEETLDSESREMGAWNGNRTGVEEGSRTSRHSHIKKLVGATVGIGKPRAVTAQTFLFPCFIVSSHCLKQSVTFPIPHGPSPT
ncbi:hypothetical protein NCS56_00061000 [Fusarium sp. Ph1]|nr:hypothetical protein NCS56_00061000 [Fusarium sp. Ph1]